MYCLKREKHGLCTQFLTRLAIMELNETKSMQVRAYCSNIYTVTEGGKRKDEDLIEKWKQKRGNASFEYLENKTDLENLNEDTDFGWFHLHLF